MATFASSIPDLDLPSIEELKQIYVKNLLDTEASNELSLYDYGYHVELSTMERKHALLSAIESNGIVKVVSKLLFLKESNINRHSTFKSQRLLEDTIWVANL